jgi:hypothetical protein
MAKHKYDYTYYKKNREETGFAFVTSYILFDEYPWLVYLFFE